MGDTKLWKSLFLWFRWLKIMAVFHHSTQRSKFNMSLTLYMDGNKSLLRYFHRRGQMSSSKKMTKNPLERVWLMLECDPWRKTLVFCYIHMVTLCCLLYKISFYRFLRLQSINKWTFSHEVLFKQHQSP